MGKALKGITVEINGSTENLVKALEKPNAEAASLQRTKGRQFAFKAGSQKHRTAGTKTSAFETGSATDRRKNETADRS